MPRMLVNLRARLDEIEGKNEWEHRFISDLCERFEINPDYRLSDEQFLKLHQVHQKYGR